MWLYCSFYVVSHDQWRFGFTLHHKARHRAVITMSMLKQKNAFQHLPFAFIQASKIELMHWRYEIQSRVESNIGQEPAHFRPRFQSIGWPIIIGWPYIGRPTMGWFMIPCARTGSNSFCWWFNSFWCRFNSCWCWCNSLLCRSTWPRCSGWWYSPDGFWSSCSSCWWGWGRTVFFAIIGWWPSSLAWFIRSGCNIAWFASSCCWSWGCLWGCCGCCCWGFWHNWSWWGIAWFLFLWACILWTRRALRVLQVFWHIGQGWEKPLMCVSMCSFTVDLTLLEKWHWAHCHVVRPSTES